MFVIPAEALLLEGVHPQAADAIVQTRGLSAAWPERFGQAFARFISRWQELAKKAPDRWWPPRLQNVVVIDDPWRVRPFYRPLSGACWVIYAADFEERSGSLELAAYTLLHAERLHSKPDIGAALIADLAYWLDRSEEEVEDFRRGAERSTRPGSGALRELASQLPEIRRCYDDAFRPAPEAIATDRLAGSTLQIPQGVQLDVAAQLASFRARCLEDYETIRRDLNATEDEGPTVSEWLVKRRPRLIVTDRARDVLWSPAQGDDIASVSEHLDALPAAVAASLIADLEEIAQITDRFFALLPEGATPRIHADSTEEDDGVYVHHELGLLAYSLHQPGGDPTQEVAPPYARQLLAARAAHEWGHVGADNGLLREPSDVTLDVRLTAIERALLPFLTQLPSDLAALVKAEGLASKANQAIRELRRRLLSRRDDLFANKIALRLTSATAMECYLRSNAPCHAEEPLGPIAQLLRAAHEYQYLGLAQIRDPLRYYMATTRFHNLFIASGWATFQQVQALFDAVSEYFESFQFITG